MDETREPGGDGKADQGGMVSFAFVVVVALLAAAVAGGRESRLPPRSWGSYLDSHGGVEFTLALPPAVRLENRRVARPGPADGPGTLWFEVFRDRLRIGTLELIVPAPAEFPSPLMCREATTAVRGDGLAAFRFQPLVPGDGETAALFRSVLDKARVRIEILDR